ncbi:MAG: hypothetical protein QM783_15565 [Phycisphaerales bacterium]
MRIPGSKVYRAFPELDRFDDVQCVRFMKGAKRDWWVKRLLRLCVSLAAFGVSLVLMWSVCWLGLAALLGAKAVDIGSGVWIALVLVAVVGPFAIAMLIAILVRDGAAAPAAAGGDQ